MAAGEVLQAADGRVVVRYLQTLLEVLPDGGVRQALQTDGPDRAVGLPGAQQPGQRMLFRGPDRVAMDEDEPDRSRGQRLGQVVEDDAAAVVDALRVVDDQERGPACRGRAQQGAGEDLRDPAHLPDQSVRIGFGVIFDHVLQQLGAQFERASRHGDQLQQVGGQIGGDAAAPCPAPGGCRRRL